MPARAQAVNVSVTFEPSVTVRFITAEGSYSVEMDAEAAGSLGLALLRAQEAADEVESLGDAADSAAEGRG